MKDVKGVGGRSGDAESVDTESTRSLSDSDDNSVTESVIDSVGESPETTAVTSSAGFFQPKPKRTVLRLQRSDAREAQAINERLVAIEQEKKANAELIKTKQVTFLELRAEYNELSEKITQEAAMLTQLIESKKENNQLLGTALEKEEKNIKPLITQVFEETENISFLAASWRAFYTAVYHVFGVKTEHEILVEKTEKIALSIKNNKETMETNKKDITEQTNTVRLNKMEYLTRRIEVDTDSSRFINERKSLEARNVELEKEEAYLSSQLPTFQHKKQVLNQANVEVINSCVPLIKRASPSAQAVAQALSDFLKTPTETTQEALATCIRDNPGHTEEPKLQKLLSEVKEYYSEVGEMLERDEPRPDM